MTDQRPPRQPGPELLTRAGGPEGRGLAEELLAWYAAHQRELPWRTAPSPYRTLVSEIMLQQTRVETVLPRFLRFLERFPTVEALAQAPVDQVLEEWSGLGYYSRARNLHKAAQAVLQRGGFPQDAAGLRALPGVGPYVAGALASIALGQDEPAVDGNVERVLSRVFAWEGEPRRVEPLLRAMLPPGRAGDLNQALMDLGSAVCTPRSPRCPACPLRAGCAGQADWARYPRKKEKRRAPEREALGIVLRRRGRVLLAQRPLEGLFGGLYELPGALLAEGEKAEAALPRLAREGLGLELVPGRHLGAVKHTLTHLRLTLQLLEGLAEPSLAADETAPLPRLEGYLACAWVELGDPGPLPLSTLTRKALELLGAGQGRLF